MSGVPAPPSIFDLLNAGVSRRWLALQGSGRTPTEAWQQIVREHNLAPGPAQALWTRLNQTRDAGQWLEQAGGNDRLLSRTFTAYPGGWTRWRYHVLVTYTDANGYTRHRMVAYFGDSSLTRTQVIDGVTARMEGAAGGRRDPDDTTPIPAGAITISSVEIMTAERAP